MSLPQPKLPLYLSASSIISKVIADRPGLTKTEITTSQYLNSKRSRIISIYSKILKRGTCSLIPLISSRLSRLDNNVFIPPSTIHKWFLQVKDADAVFAFCGLEPSETDGFVNVVYRSASNRAAASRANHIIFRIMEAFTDDVAPVFWTLTVDPDHEHIIGKGRREFEIWLRKVKRSFGPFQYCSVVERGEQNGRLHYHTLFLFRNAHQWATDPNRGTSNGTKRELPELRGFWPYGLSNPIAIRIGPTDYYGQLGWMWPAGCTAGSIEAIAKYMAKYMSKPREELNGCRTRMTRGFGLQKLNTMTRPQATLIMLGEYQKVSLQLKLKSKPPNVLMKYCAARIIHAKQPLLPLPPTKIGSVQQAAETIGTVRLARKNAGDLINDSVGFKGELDEWRNIVYRTRIGKII